MGRVQILPSTRLDLLGKVDFFNLLSFFRQAAAPLVMRPIHWRLELGVDRVPALGVCTYRWDTIVIFLMHAEVLLP